MNVTPADLAAAVLRGHLVVYGDAGANSCVLAEVNAATLHLSDTRTFDCKQWPPGHDTYVLQESIPGSHLPTRVGNPQQLGALWRVAGADPQRPNSCRSTLVDRN